jgi:hypothetical protein
VPRGKFRPSKAANTTLPVFRYENVVIASHYFLFICNENHSFFHIYEGVSKIFRTESITKYTNPKGYGGKTPRLTHKIAIQLHLVAQSCTICSSRSRRPVRKLLRTPSYVYTNGNFELSKSGIFFIDKLKILQYARDLQCIITQVRFLFILNSKMSGTYRRISSITSCKKTSLKIPSRTTSCDFRPNTCKLKT